MFLLNVLHDLTDELDVFADYLQLKTLQLLCILYSILMYQIKFPPLYPAIKFSIIFQPSPPDNSSKLNKRWEGGCLLSSE